MLKEPVYVHVKALTCEEWKDNSEVSFHIQPCLSFVFAMQKALEANHDVRWPTVWVQLMPLTVHSNVVLNNLHTPHYSRCSLCRPDSVRLQRRAWQVWRWWLVLGSTKNSSADHLKPWQPQYMKLRRSESYYENIKSIWRGCRSGPMETACHASTRNWVWLPIIHIKLDVVASICNPNKLQGREGRNLWTSYFNIYSGQQEGSHQNKVVG